MTAIYSAASLSYPSLASKEEDLVKHLLQTLIKIGVEEFCLCPGKRNAPLVYPLVNSSRVKLYLWPEERSAAFFALGRIKATGRPVAVVATSGTAVGELLPATMEAYYSGLPLVLLTADRPKRFRGTGAPQSAEQVGIFSHYLHAFQDLEAGETLNLAGWFAQGPLQLNICLEEPQDAQCKEIVLDEEVRFSSEFPFTTSNSFTPDPDFISFLNKVRYPLVIVGALPPSCREETVKFLFTPSSSCLRRGAFRHQGKKIA